MKERINVSYFSDKESGAKFVIMPLHEYKRLQKRIQSNRIEEGTPISVVELAFKQNISSIKAWRKYLGLTQSEIAKKLKITQACFSKYESSESLPNPIKRKIAKVMGLTFDQLDW